MHFNTQFQADQLHETVFVGAGATVLGDVTIGSESSIWFGAVVRGDSERIVIGNRTNVQDLTLIHADEGLPCTIGNGVTLGHCAIVHGATVEDDVMIGMRATVLNGARIGAGSVIAAGAVVTEGTTIPPGSLVMGLPAKVRGQVTAEHRERIRYAAEHYVAAAKAMRETS